MNFVILVLASQAYTINQLKNLKVEFENVKFIAQLCYTVFSAILKCLCIIDSSKIQYVLREKILTYPVWFIYNRSTRKKMDKSSFHEEGRKRK